MHNEHCIAVSVPVVDHAEFMRRRHERAQAKGVNSTSQPELALSRLEAELNAMVDQIVRLAATYETKENNLGPRMIFMIEGMKASAKERLGLDPGRAVGAAEDMPDLG